ncbi:PhoD-like phosphatase-domain-containing protein [Massariosphaeria phaeospora]|uniref:PhoD-like phosphatase-domain-containing protein n=1 Tax=Massariosphaeria phaeospora TaxID=100035 RepID=A0A7C8IBP7_9PLEO|nr:PhoD-like phosphatase-domain-containing protein [Massariosphaeria phaeospora]
MKLPSLPLLTVLTSTTVIVPITARWSTNLNYRSPSTQHPALGIAVHKVVKRSTNSSAWDPAALHFTHGVASGDPYADSVILWTRVGPTDDNDRSNVTVSGYAGLFNHDVERYVAVSKAPVCVEYRVYGDEGMEDVVDGGTVYTSSDVDYTVKVEAKNLQPFTTYYYQFSVCNSNTKSIVGRTKTTPNADDDITKVSLAVYSCSNYPFGFFNAYGNSVRKDSVDYVVHLGDYIYEYANGDYGWGNSIDRIPQPDKEIVSLYDYRKRLATYRTDLDLLTSHQRFPWIPVWDDHEVADNSYRDGTSEMNNTEDSFIKEGRVSFDQRKMHAVRAYFEWMPIRQVEMDDNLRIWRSFSIGKLVDLVMLDTRNYDRSVTDLYWNTDYAHAISNDAGRSLMGARQEHWFYDSLSHSAERGATWRIIGSQVIFSRINGSVGLGNENPLNYDQWDGYQSNRNRTLSHLYDNGIGNNIFLAGDSHASWVSDLVWLGEKEYNKETGEGSIGVEFAGTAVSSPCPYGANITLAGANNFSSFLERDNDELQWQDLYYRGYYELHFSADEVEAKYFGLPTVVSRNGWEIPIANFTVKAGENKLQRPVGGGVVESGSLKGGERKETNLTVDTNNGTWFISHADLSVL